MNKVFNINLGGLALTIDEDAYGNLKSYLKNIRSHFKDSEGCDEIVFDIEARMAEIFQEKLSSHQIVSNDDVQDAINIMGTPEEFAGDSIFDEPEKNDSSGQEKAQEQTYSTPDTAKRLYRHPEDQLLGGVCSGVSLYFGINDPVWLRLAFVICFFAFGFGLPIYIVLWVIIPKAKNSADKLSMHGKSITVSNIAKNIEEEISHIRDRFSSFSNEFGSEKKKVVNPVTPSDGHYRR